MRKALVSTFIAVLLAAGVSAQSADVLIKNATVLTASRGTLENTDILIRGGKIAEPVNVELAWRDAVGQAHRETIRLEPGWHTIVLGSTARALATSCGGSRAISNRTRCPPRCCRRATTTCPPARPRWRG